MRLTDFKVLTFDCYGTLIDWESGMVKALTPLTSKSKRELSRNQILEAHARHESLQQKYTPAKLYRHLLPVVYKRLAEEWGISVDWDECIAYGQSIGDWLPFDDTLEALQYLKRFFKLVILSNVDNASFAETNKKLKVDFDAIYTAEDIGSYKPSPRNFDYLLENLAALGITKVEILHTAESLFHDHAPANSFGLASAWIFRRHAQEGFGATLHPGATPKYNFMFRSLADMVKAHEEQLRG
jgi:2-haloacid dehalogenase